MTTIKRPAQDDEAWRSWTPGLDNDSMTLGEVYRTLPGFAPGAVHPLVRLFENPASPLALPGAATLEAHDCLHILLGRGLLNQDEAFVIGASMAAARATRRWHVWLFKRIARWLYTGIYRANANDLIAFDLGFAYGQRNLRRDAARFPFGAYWETPLATLRRKINIDPDMLRRVYREERRRIPDTVASARLPVDPPEPLRPRTPERLAA